MASIYSGEGSPQFVYPGSTASSPSSRTNPSPWQSIQQGDTNHGSSNNNQGVILGNAVNSTVIGQNIINNFNSNVFMIPSAPELSTVSKQGDLQPRYKTEDNKLYTTNSDQLVDIARDWESKGNSQDALASYNVAFVSRRKDLGPWNPKTIETAYDIARILEVQNKAETALEWYREIFEVRQKSLGNTDPRTLETACSVARMLARHGRYTAALKWYDQVFEVRKKILGSDHLETLDAAYAIAEILEFEGRNEVALRWYEETLEVRMRVLGKDHSEIMKTEKSVERVRGKIGRYSTALKWHENY